MRILIVSEDIPYPSMGGLAKHALNLARTLVQAGHEVDILGGDQHPIEVSGAEGEFGGRFFGELSGHASGWKELNLGMFVPARRTWIARRFARSILRHAARYDVVHYHGHMPNVAQYIPANVNFVQTRHDHGSDCLINTRFRDDAICNAVDPVSCAACRTRNPNLVQRAVSAAAVVRFREEVAQGFRRHKTVFVSDMLHRNLTRTLGPGKWGAVVHNFADSAAIIRAREAAQCASTEKFQVFIAAKLYPAKGVEPFLRQVAPRLRPDMTITIAGDGGDEAGLRAAFESDSIRFLGWRTSDETLAIAAGAQAIVVPSVWEEPCASTILEGLLLGKPTFALALGGTPELAVYASYRHQLRLHATIDALVDDLVTFIPDVDYRVAPRDGGSAEQAVKQLLQIYNAPPGKLSIDQRHYNPVLADHTA